MAHVWLRPQGDVSVSQIGRVRCVTLLANSASTMVTLVAASARPATPALDAMRYAQAAGTVRTISVSASLSLVTVAMDAKSPDVLA